MVCLLSSGSLAPQTNAQRPPSISRVNSGSLALELKTASGLAARARYTEALAALLPLEIRAHSEQQTALEAQILTNIGGCYYATRNYASALRTFMQARALAEGTAQHALLAIVGVNISSLYFKMDNLDAAEDESQRSLQVLDGLSAGQCAQIHCQLGRIAMRRGQVAAGRRSYATALDLARQSGLPATEASVLEHYSYDLLQSGDASGARQRAREALQLRLHDHLAGTEVAYWALGRAAARAGETHAAERYYQLAFKGATEPRSSMPLWALYRDRGKLRLQRGRLRGAISDLRIALEQAERVAVIPTDDNRIAFESGLAEIYQDFVEAGNSLALRTPGNTALMRETFEANERGRYYSLRALLPLANEWRSHLPPLHGELLAQLQTYQRRALSRPSPAVRDAIRRLHVALEETELAAGAAADPVRVPAFSKIRRMTGTEDAFVSVVLGAQDSWLWSITAAGLRMHRLPSRAVIAAAAREFTRAIQTESADATPRGSQLYQMLFGAAEKEIGAKGRWLLSLDGDLFSVPLTALVADTRGRRPVYLMERHAVQYVTGAQMLHAAPQTPVDGLFIGLGDPVYNTADPRYDGRREGEPSLPGETDLHLTRLNGSGRELEISAAAWGRERSSLLLGEQASKLRLRQAMRRHPAVLHLATHVLQAPDRFHSGVIALSLNTQRQVDLLSADEIVRQAQAAPLVVLSGCGTGRATALPGAGLMGLTRAWIGAGADAVLATLWPTEDDDGHFFQPFYESLRQAGTTPAMALQRAQIAMLHSGTFRASPDYWSTYFVVENDR